MNKTSNTQPALCIYSWGSLLQFPSPQAKSAEFKTKSGLNVDQQAIKVINSISCLFFSSCKFLESLIIVFVHFSVYVCW